VATVPRENSGAPRISAVPRATQDEGTMMASLPINDELTELHETYVWEVNAAVGSNDDAFVKHLANEYTERALRLLTSPRRAS
jgi:hypothetical protein